VKIVIDIETIQVPKEEWAVLQGIELRNGNDENPCLGLEESQIEKDYYKSSFDGTFSRIVCIGILKFTEDMTFLDAKALYGENEKEILLEFWKQFSEKPPQLIITYNGLGFDLPFIKKRSIIHQVKPAFDISLAKFRTSPVYDVMAVWANWEVRGFVKLDVLARALGVETKMGSGAQVAEMWNDGKAQEIADYCLKDTYITYACYCRMTFREPLESSQILGKKTLCEIS